MTGDDGNDYFAGDADRYVYYDEYEYGYDGYDDTNDDDLLCRCGC